MAAEYARANDVAPAARRPQRSPRMSACTVKRQFRCGGGVSRDVGDREITTALDRMQQRALEVRDAADARTLIDGVPAVLLTLEEESPEERRLMEISVYLLNFVSEGSFPVPAWAREAFRRARGR